MNRVLIVETKAGVHPWSAAEAMTASLIVEDEGQFTLDPPLKP